MLYINHKKELLRSLMGRVFSRRTWKIDVGDTARALAEQRRTHRRMLVVSLFSGLGCGV